MEVQAGVLSGDFDKRCAEAFEDVNGDQLAVNESPRLTRLEDLATEGALVPVEFNVSLFEDFLG